MTAVLLVLIGIAVTEIALWGRRQQSRAAQQRGYLDGLLQTTGAQVVGAFRLVAATHVARPTREQRQVAILLADEVATALQREAIGR